MAEIKPMPSDITKPVRSSAIRMYAVVVGVGIACAVAIVTVYETTRPVIRRNAIEFRNRAILEVLPGATSSGAFRFNVAGEFKVTSPDSLGTDLVFAGYDANKRLVGLAIEAEAMGYQDLIRVMYGYSFEKEAIVGISVIQSRETPGVGDRIETDGTFMRNFEALDVHLIPSGKVLAHRIEFVKPGEKDSPWQIDGISGATISSRTIAKMLEESSAKWVPIVNARRRDFLLNHEKEP